MNEKYDVIVCGTGLKECILSGLLSTRGMKVLHIDRNPYYGGECASVNITTLYKLFREGKEPPKEYGHNRDWNVDLIPKFVMANGNLVKILLLTRVSKYLEWKCVDGSYVYQFKKGGIFSSDKGAIYKVPANDSEALKSDLMGLFEKRRCRNFLLYVDAYDQKNIATQDKFDATKNNGAALFKKFGLEPNTIDFIGHSMALYQTDEFMELAAINLIDKCKLYADSMGRYGENVFLYPIYGLGGIPEGFSRLAAIHGGTYMLRTNADEMLFESGKVAGIRSGADKAFAPIVICDPSYVMNIPGRVKKVGQVIRAICLLQQPIPNTQNAHSCQVIIPQKQVGRKHDIYIAYVSAAHCICPKDFSVAMISTTVETTNPEAEIQLAFQLIGKPKEVFVTIKDVFEPVVDGKADGLFVSKGYDATSHFESSVDDVMEMYFRITGTKLDLTNLPPDEDDEQAAAAPAAAAPAAAAGATPTPPTKKT